MFCFVYSFRSPSPSLSLSFAVALANKVARAHSHTHKQFDGVTCLSLFPSFFFPLCFSSCNVLFVCRCDMNWNYI